MQRKMSIQNEKALPPKLQWKGKLLTGKKRSVISWDWQTRVLQISLTAFSFVRGCQPCQENNSDQIRRDLEANLHNSTKTNKPQDISWRINVVLRFEQRKISEAHSVALKNLSAKASFKGLPIWKWRMLMIQLKSQHFRCMRTTGHISLCKTKWKMKKDDQKLVRRSSCLHLELDRIKIL